MEASSAGEFWKEIKRLIDPALNPISVSADNLKDISERRLNVPETLPQSFGASQHAINRILASSIPATTTDTTREQLFSREWTEADIESLKEHIREGMGTATGEDAPTLWLKLLPMGMGGTRFDWLRMLYQKMAYHVRHGDRNSAEFKSFIGLLTGDPASPVLWNLFMADLIMLDDIDDPILCSIRIAILAQATSS
ncbi:hypothetical protein K438DRAFT_1970195 [Mycena galopus ATCC 62051]|nr:hypothetical protein K438DRAFT_1970195 [Mycena galopus ATCC 62051]